MIPASLLALHLHVPIATVSGYLDERILDSGPRLGAHQRFSLNDANVTVLVVDDSVYSGRQMNEVKGRIQARGIQNNVLFAAPYVAPGTEEFVDYYCESIPQPRVFEWNVMHHEILSEACVDIDGVLCRDPTSTENDDGSAYQTFINTVEPLFQPRKPIRALVTCRLDKYRAPTEAWLDRCGIEYDQLIMMDYPTMKARRKASRHAEYKAKAYRETKAKLFVESSPHQAMRIAREAGMPVYCVSTRELITPDKLSVEYAKAQTRSYWDRAMKWFGRTWKSPSEVPRWLLSKIRGNVVEMKEVDANNQDFAHSNQEAKSLQEN
jgi:orotate phosphoribosyltransferase